MASPLEHQEASVLSGGSSLLVVMQATDFWNLGDLPGFSILDLTWLRAVHVQRKVGAPVVVVAEVAASDTRQMVP